MLFWQLDLDTALNLDPHSRAQAGHRQTDQRATRRLPSTQAEDHAQRSAARAWRASEAEATGKESATTAICGITRDKRQRRRDSP